MLINTGRSQAGGNIWTSSGPAADIRALALDPITPSRVYAGTDDSLGGGSIFRSTDGGSTWSEVANLGASVYAIVIAPTTPSAVYAGTIGEAGIFNSDDGGTTWHHTNNGLNCFFVQTLAFDPLRPDILYAGTDGGCVFRSTDRGSSWNDLDARLPGFVESIVIDPLLPSTIYAGTLYGVVKTVDSGATWVAASRGLPTGRVNGYALAIDPLTPSTLYAGTDIFGAGRIFKTTDAGALGLPVQEFPESRSARC